MKKKILIAAYDMAIGGVERSLASLTHLLDYERYDVDLFLFSHTGELLQQLSPGINLLPEDPHYASLLKPVKQVRREKHFLLTLLRCLPHVDMNLTSRKWRNSGKELSFYAMQRIRDYTFPVLPRLQKKYDAAISYTWPHHFVLQKVKANTKIAWVHTDYGTAYMDHKRDLKQWSAFDHIAAVSQGVADAFAGLYPALAEKLTVVENTLFGDLIEAQANAFTPGDEMPQMSGVTNVLSVGRFSYPKAFDEVVQSCAILREQGYNVKWYLIGFGHEEALIRQKIAEYRMEEHFIILGKKINPYPYIKHCDIYAQPSRYEGRAVTVQEAQLLQKPVMITDFPTAKSQVQAGVDGYIAPMGPVGAAEGIAYLIDHPQECETYIENQRTHAERYVNAAQVQKIVELIEGESPL